MFRYLRLAEARPADAVASAVKRAASDVALALYDPPRPEARIKGAVKEATVPNHEKTCAFPEQLLGPEDPRIESYLRIEAAASRPYDAWEARWAEGGHFDVTGRSVSVCVPIAKQALLLRLGVRADATIVPVGQSQRAVEHYGGQSNSDPFPPLDSALAGILDDLQGRLADALHISFTIVQPGNGRT